MKLSCRKLNRLVTLLMMFHMTCVVYAAPKVDVIINTDRSDAIYTQGQPVTFYISATQDDKPIIGQTVSYTLSKDSFATLDKGSITLAEKPVAVTTTLNEPGFVKIFVNVPGYLDYKNREKPAIGGAAVDPLLIKPSMNVPDDFDAYWAAKKKLVHDSPMKPVLTPVPCKLDDVLAFDLQLNCPDTQGNTDGAPVSGYFAMPKDARPGKCPAILFPHSAGVKSAYLNNPVDRGAAVGMIGLDFNAHGIANGKDKKYYDELAKGDLSDYRTRGREDRETSYFTGMYMRLFRALQFLKSRPEWDGRTLIVWGSSQGGGQTLVAGGLDSDITLLLAGVPAMCDHNGSTINRQSGWPQMLKGLDPEKDKATWDKVVSASRYVDAANFASRIKTSVIVTAGFCDVTCAPTSVYAAYNAIPSQNKQIYNGIHMEHNQNDEVWNLFKNAAFDHAKKAIAENQ